MNPIEVRMFALSIGDIPPHEIAKIGAIATIGTIAIFSAAFVIYLLFFRKKAPKLG